MPDDYRSDYKGKVFGVKRMGSFFAVEEANLFGDLSKYDFILKDRLTYSYNGNHNYCVEVMKEACEEPVFNGWKLDNLYFYGNWYGQAPAYNLIDKFDESYHSSQFSDERNWYDKQPEVMIRETLLKVMKFTEHNYSVKYWHIINGFDIPKGEVSVEKFKAFNDALLKYINDYQDLTGMLKEENAIIETIICLKDGFDTQIKKCFPFVIRI